MSEFALGLANSANVSNIPKNSVPAGGIEHNTSSEEADHTRGTKELVPPSSGTKGFIPPSSGTADSKESLLKDDSKDIKIYRPSETCARAKRQWIQFVTNDGTYLMYTDQAVKADLIREELEKGNFITTILHGKYNVIVYDILDDYFGKVNTWIRSCLIYGKCMQLKQRIVEDMKPSKGVKQKQSKDLKGSESDNEKSDKPVACENCIKYKLVKSEKKYTDKELRHAVLNGVTLKIKELADEDSSNRAILTSNILTIMCTSYFEKKSSVKKLFRRFLDIVSQDIIPKELPTFMKIIEVIVNETKTFKEFIRI